MHFNKKHISNEILKRSNQKPNAQKVLNVIFYSISKFWCETRISENRSKILQTYKMNCTETGPICKAQIYNVYNRENDKYSV